VLVAAAFTLRAIQTAFFGMVERGVPDALSETRPEAGFHPPLPPITWPEKAGVLLLVGATIYIGLSPDTLLDWIRPALQSPYFHAILTGGAS